TKSRTRLRTPVQVRCVRLRGLDRQRLDRLRPQCRSIRISHCGLEVSSWQRQSVRTFQGERETAARCASPAGPRRIQAWPAEAPTDLSALVRERLRLVSSNIGQTLLPRTNVATCRCNTTALLGSRQGLMHDQMTVGLRLVAAERHR